MNEEGSILKQSLVVTGKLVGISAVWVALVSFVVVTITGRAVGSLSGASPSAAEKASAIETDARAPQRTTPPPNPAKPNG